MILFLYIFISEWDDRGLERYVDYNVHLGRSLMHSLALNTDQHMHVSVDHVGAIDDGYGRGSKVLHVIDHVNSIG